MLLTEAEKALAGLLAHYWGCGVRVHVPVEVLDTIEHVGALKIETDIDGCYDVTLELEGYDGR